MGETRRQKYLVLICSIALFISLGLAFEVTVFADAGTIKGTVSAVTVADDNAPPRPLDGVRMTLVNRDLPGQSVKTITDHGGNFVFTALAAAVYLLRAEADGFPPVTREINLSAGSSLSIEIELRATLSETVTVREEEGLLSTGETTTTNTLRSQTLKDTPLRAENYQSALLLTPGVVRGRDGADHLKGARADQSAYTVNGVDVTDPVSGQLAFDIPLEAAASVQIEENPYAAEFGRLTGGSTNLETRGGSDQFKFNITRFLPTFHHVFGSSLDSFRPRLTLSGPVIQHRLYFLQSFEYRFSRTYVPSLPAGRDNASSESFNSFTQFDLTINKQNRVKFVAAIFPQKTRFIGLNTFNPQEVTPNLKQRGSLFSISEQMLLGDASFLTSSLSYKSFDVDVFAQGGEEPLTVTPEGNTGSYFADTRRRSRRFQWQETYYANPFTLAGRHSLKLGAEFDHTQLQGRFRFRPVLIRRRDNSLAERVDFAGGSSLISRSVGEVAAFLQDRWVVGKRLTIDAGLRLDRDAIARRYNPAPRFSFLLLPFKSERTILRAGIGLFYDRSPFSIGYFETGNDRSDGGGGGSGGSDNPQASSASSPSLSQLPERIVTRFAPVGGAPADGPRFFRNDVDERLRNPRSVRWSVQIDQGFTKHLTGRIGFLHRSTSDDLIIEPLQSGSQTGTLLLSSHGRSSYRELQLLANYSHRRLGSWNASYVWSRAEGNLNTVDNYLGDYPSLVARPNERGPLPWDTPHRFLAFGQFKTPFDITVSPVVEVRSGYPFSVVNEYLDFVGARNKAGRFPVFVSLDVQATKDFIVPKFVPRLEGKRARFGAAVFNITNHFNPRDVQNNTDSTRFSQFFNSLGTSVRGKFELDF